MKTDNCSSCPFSRAQEAFIFIALFGGKAKMPTEVPLATGSFAASVPSPKSPETHTPSSLSQASAHSADAGLKKQLSYEI